MTPPPGGDCLQWDLWAVLGFVGGEAMVGTCFVFMGAAIFYTVRAYRLGTVMSRLVPLLRMFSIFLFCSGFTRVCEALVIFFPVFWIVIMSLVFTSVASVLTCWQVITKRSDLLIALGAEKIGVR